MNCRYPISFLTLIQDHVQRNIKFLFDLLEVRVLRGM